MLSFKMPFKDFKVKIKSFRTVVRAMIKPHTVHCVTIVTELVEKTAVLSLPFHVGGRFV